MKVTPGRLREAFHPRRFINPLPLVDSSLPLFVTVFILSVERSTRPARELRKFTRSAARLATTIVSCRTFGSFLRLQVWRMKGGDCWIFEISLRGWLLGGKFDRLNCRLRCRSRVFAHQRRIAWWSTRFLSLGRIFKRLKIVNLWNYFAL